jgi:hypothetical protein
VFDSSTSEHLVREVYADEIRESSLRELTERAPVTTAVIEQSGLPV